MSFRKIVTASFSPRSLKHQADVFWLHGWAPPVVEVILEVPITNSELQLLQKLRVVHQVESVEHVEVGLKSYIPHYSSLKIVVARPLATKSIF